MNVTVLIENTAREGSGLQAEAGLSLHIAHRGRSILLDGGSSGKFAQNAAALGIDLAGVDAAVLSHGHFDHADGLRQFFVCNQTAQVYLRPTAGGAYFSTSTGEPRFVGIHRGLWEEAAHRFQVVDGLTDLGDGIWLVPETIHGGSFASRERHLLRKVGEDQFVPDDFSHEHSLVLEGEEGLVVFNSCSHGGIVNIVRGVEEQLNRPVRAVVGGFHLYSPGANNGLNCTPDYVRQVAQALVEDGVTRIYTGHCTGSTAYGILEEELGDRLSPLSGGLVFTL